MQGANSTLSDDYYGLLGVPVTATAASIKQAFRSLARSLHPDKGGDPHLFGRVQHAASVLLDPQQRLVYDQTQHSHAPHPFDSNHLSHSTADTPQEVHGAHGHYSAAFQLQDVWDDDEEEEVPADATTAGRAPHTTQAASIDGCSNNVHTKPACMEETSSATHSTPAGMSSVMLDLLAAQGVVCDASTQLVVTCERCHCPATRACSLCGFHMCELCTRCMHSKGQYGLHWPMVNQPGLMAARLAQREFEAKRLEDAKRFEASQPGYVPEAQRIVMRNFQEAAAKAAMHPAAQRHYVPELGGHYMWTQTAGTVYIAVHLPEGRPGQHACAQVDIEPGGVMRVWTPSQNQLQRLHHVADAVAAGEATDLMCTPAPAGVLSLASATASPATANNEGGNSIAAPQQQRGYEAAASSHTFYVIDRQLAGVVDMSLPVEIMRTECNCFMVITLAKATVGRMWPSLFVGDGHGVRSVVVPGSPAPAYRLQQDDMDEVVMEMDLPHWVTTDDVTCDISTTGVRINVRGCLQLARTFWTPSKDKSAVQLPMITPQRSSWVLTTEPTSKCSRTTAAINTQHAQSSGTLHSSVTAMRFTATGASAVKAVGKQRAPKLLTLFLSKRELTMDEQQYKRGVRQDNLACTPPASFFVEDEDEWGLAGLLQQVLKQQQGRKEPS